MVQLRYAQVAALLLLSLARPCGAEVFVTVATDKAQYVPGEVIRIDVTVHNPDPVNAVLNPAVNARHDYRVDQIYRPNELVFESAQLTIPAGTSHTFNRMAYDWARNQRLFPGDHSLVGRVYTYSGYQSSAPVQFEVMPVEAPRNDFLIDFDRMPDTGLRPNYESEYLRFGVYFRGAGANRDAPLAIYPANGNRYLRDWLRLGAVAADFDMPVFGASMNVRIQAGRTVRLLALDAAGNVLGEVISPTATSSIEFFPMQIASELPIASLEWHGDAPGAELHMDDLFVTVPEPVTLLGAAIFVAALMRRRRLADQTPSPAFPRSTGGGGMP